MNHCNFLLLRTPLQTLDFAYTVKSELPSIFLEGLHLASPEFVTELEKNEIPSTKEKLKLELSLLKYWVRSCTRCTPFGTFAGSAVVAISDEPTSVVLMDNQDHIKKVRIDMNYISLITAKIETSPLIQRQLKLYSNNSLYETFNEFRYAEYTIQNNRRIYKLTSVDKEDYLRLLLDFSKNGKTVDELASKLTSFIDVTYDEAKAFVLELWSSQILVSELELTITGKEPIVQLIASLKRLDGTHELSGKLELINDLLQNFREGITYLKDVENKLKEVFDDIVVPKNTLQTDLFLSVKESNLNSKVVNEILTQIEDLTALSRKNSVLEDFKKKFIAKFDKNEVPLTIALDADLGIGYAGIEDQMAGESEWVNDIMMRTSKSSSITFDYINDYTLSKYLDLVGERKSIIEITEEELQNLKRHAKDLRLSNNMYAIGELSGANSELFSSDFNFTLVAINAPSAARLLGRFTHGDEKLYNLTKSLLQEEEEEDAEAIYAEIAHLPQARVGNILLRPILRRYEIPYVGKSGIDLANQIPIEDLTLRVRNNEIILWSKKLRKRILPRLSTAHNFNTESLPIYKFLCDLQFQGLADTCVWDWGPLSNNKYLPRVVYKNIILKKARWKIDLKDISDMPINPEEYSDYFVLFRKKWDIPQKILFVQNDNKLLIDFNEPLGIQLFLGYLRKLKTLTVEEFLFSKGECFVKDVHGLPYTNEMIIPLKNTNSIKVAKSTANDAGVSKSVKQAFPPLSEWLSVKVYVGSKTLENILTKCILPFVEEGLKKNSFEKFFFVRYRDDQHHLRIRFYNTDVEKQVKLYVALNNVLKPLLENGVIEKIIIDTYIREIERYNAELIEQAESIFFNDSLAVLRFLNLLEPHESLKYKILLALRAIDIFLNQFQLVLSEKRELVSMMFSGFFSEFNGQSYLKQRLNDKYRANQKLIFSHMDHLQDSLNGIEEATAVFESRSISDHPIVQTILEKGGEEHKKLVFDLLPSYLHMFMNRLFISQQRKYELLIYCFLERYYTAQVSILKKNTEMKFNKNLENK